MLKTFRDNLKYLSWVLWLVIAVFILFVFADFGGIQLGGTAPTDAAASVGSLDISYAEFERSYRQTEDFYRQSYGEQFNRELAQQIGLPIQVLDQLIAEKILLAEADRMGLRITDEELVGYITEIPAFQLSDGRFVGEDRYQQILRSNGFTVERFEESARIDLLSQKVRDVLSQNLYVSDDDVIDDYKGRVETASIRYIRLPSAEMRDQVVISDEELTAYFDEQRDDFRIPERRVVDYVLVDPERLRSTIEVSDEDLRAYYDANSADFQQEEQVKARHILLQVNADRTEEQAEAQMEEIRSRLAQGEDFAALARELSDDPGSKIHGGDLGFFGRGQMIPEFENAAFEAQPGDLVGPVRTSFGYHLIEVLEQQPAGQKPFETAAAEIREQLVDERARAAAEAKINELAERIREQKPESLAALQTVAGGDPGVSIQSTEPFAQGDSVPGIGRAAVFASAAFELEPGAFSSVVPIDRGSVVMRLSAVEEPRIPELEEVRDAVRDALLDERQVALAQSRLEEARLSIQEGKTLDEVAGDLGLAVTESGEIRRQGSVTGLGRSPELAAAALSLDAGKIGGPLVHDNDVILFEVTDRQRYDPLKFEQEKGGARETLRQERLTEMLASIISQRREEMGVRYDPQLLQNFEITTGEG